MIDPLLATCWACLAMAAVPAYFYFRNRGVYRRAPRVDQRELPPLSVLVPARNEAANIGPCVDAIMAAAEGVEVEVVVLDDASEDDTAAIVRRISAADPRVRLIETAPLPAGWNGKQHACQRLADAATHANFLWIDADVRLAPGSLARLLTERERVGADLLSGFPRQITVTTLERWLLPLIHFLLLGFLSLRGMRRSERPGLSAGCGQLFMTHREAYRAAGGHDAIRDSRHDGVTLPRAYRRAGLKTDLVDATDLAACRMYDSAAAVWTGLTKNATEGVAKPALLPVVTAMLLLGQVLPIPLGLYAAWSGQTQAALVCGLAIAFGYAQRFDAARRFQQPLDGAAAHPVAVLLFLIIQWEALARERLGRPVPWKGRP